MEKFKIPFPGLLNDLVNFSEDAELKAKVKRVYYKCIRARKIDIADKIEMKYSQFFKRGSDTALAFH